MISRVKINTIRLVNKLNNLLFGHDMGENMKDFLSHLSWSIVGVFFSSLIMFVISIILGRCLGPEEYGKYNLVTTMAGVLLALFFFGGDNMMVKYVSGSDDKEEQNKILTNTLIWQGLATILFGSVLLLFSSNISKLFKTDSYLIVISISYGIIFALKLQLDNFIKAKRKFKYQAKIRLLENILVFVSVVIFLVFLKYSNYFWGVLSLIIGAVTTVTIYWLKLKNKIGHWDWNVFEKTKKYLFTSLSSALVWMIVGNMDKFFVSGFMGIKDFGIYCAYLTSFNSFIIQLIFAIGNVLFPTVSKHDDKKKIVNKINTMVTKIFLPMVIVSSLLSLLVMKMFGNAYSINYLYLLLTGVVAWLQLIVVLYGGVVASSSRLFKQTTRVFYFKPLFLLVLYYLAVKTNSVSIFVVFLIYISNFLFDIVNSRMAFRKI